MSVREPWVKIAARMPNNPKLRGVSIPARWAYTCSICYAGANLTDGFIPDQSLSLIDGSRKLAAELAAQGLWEPVAGGWVIHDFLTWNRSREKVEATSDIRAEMGSKGGNARWQNATKPDSKTKANSSLSASAPVVPEQFPPDPDDLSDPAVSDEKQTDSNLLRTTPGITDELRARMVAKYAPVASIEDVEVEIQRCLLHHGAKQKKKPFDYGLAVQSWLRGAFGRELQMKLERDQRNGGAPYVPDPAIWGPDPGAEPTLKERYDAACYALVTAGKAASLYSARELMSFDEWRKGAYAEVEN